MREKKGLLLAHVADRLIVVDFPHHHDHTATNINNVDDGDINNCDMIMKLMMMMTKLTLPTMIMISNNNNNNNI